MKLSGRGGNDAISLVAGRTPGDWTLTVNGMAHSIGLNTTSLNIDGLGGNNTITIIGTGKSEERKSGPIIWYSTAAASP